MPSRPRPRLPQSACAVREVWSAICRELDSRPNTVTTLSSFLNPRSTCSGSHGLRSSYSAKQVVNLPIEPSVERSISPGFAPPTLRSVSFTARPMVALARLP